MKHSIQASLFLSAIALWLSASVNAVVPVRDGSKASIKIERLGDSYISPIEMSAQSKVKRTPNNDFQDVQYIKIDEDFSMLPAGTAENPTEICPYMGLDGEAPIDNAFTHEPGWSGSWVYSTGNAIMIASNTPNDNAFLRTPKGDYSGHVTVSFKMKFLPCEWEVYEYDGSVSHFTRTKGTLQVCPIAYNKHMADTNIPEEQYGTFDINSAEGDGWMQVTLNFDNYTADNDGCIAFLTRYKFLIDDVHITTAQTFLASPVMLNWSNVTNTSFTANWMPVDRAFDYYINLWEYEGTDAEGKPILKRSYDGLSDEDKDFKASILEMVESGMWPEGVNYFYWGATYETGNDKATSWTFTGLDPEKEYYVSVQSHNVDMWSDAMVVYHAMVVGAPDELSADNVNPEAGSYTAHWTNVPKADLYMVNNYGVKSFSEATANYALIDEDFSAINADVTSATGINNAQTVSNIPVDYLDSYTCNPGWLSYSATTGNAMAVVAQGMVGGNGYGVVATPSLYVANGDQVVVDVDIVTQAPQIYVLFAGVTYMLPLTQGQTHYSFPVPTNGITEGSLAFRMNDEVGNAFLLDRVTITQDIPAGSQVYHLLASKQLVKGSLECDFENINFDLYDNVGFNVTCYHSYQNPLTDQEEAATSPYMMPFLLNYPTVAISKTSIDKVNTNATPAYYDLKGARVAQPQHGLFIKIENGKATKVVK